jgi:hypothetical protein
VKLTQKEAPLYWDLMTELQLFVNREKEIVTGVKSREELTEISNAEKLKIREALYGNPNLIEVFVKKNPPKLSSDKLVIVSKWVHFKRGKFFIERCLKAHSIFILDDSVYSVHGISSGIDEVLSFADLPYYADAVLLPFKGRIIFDGILLGRNILFGAGLKRQLKEVYMTAKQNNRIIQQLDPGSVESKPEVPMKPAKEYGTQIEELMKQAKCLKGGRNRKSEQRSIHLLENMPASILCLRQPTTF